MFTAIVQNSVHPRGRQRDGSLTFFQQIGGTIGLTIASTIFASRLIEEIPPQLVATGVPQQFIDQFQAQQGGGQALDLTGTGDLGTRILAQVPDQFKALVEPLIPQIVAGIHEAFSLAVASTFWIGIAGAALAALAVLFLKEIQCARPSRWHPRRRKRRRPRSPARLLQAKAPRPDDSLPPVL